MNDTVAGTNPTVTATAGQALSRQDFEARLRRIGAERYHDKHPFHHLLHGGRLGIGQVRAWVVNRYYYQSRIPMKDAALLSRCDDRELRREWRRRIEAHDGSAAVGVDTEGGGGEGGIERWLKLAAAVGLDRDYVVSCAGVLPATRFACDAYVRFVAERTLLEAVASSLTELFAPSIHQERIAGLLQHYDFATEETLAYFRRRLVEAPEDVRFGLDWVLDNARTAERQDAAAAALVFKTDVLWAQLDALHHAYVVPGAVPPGAYVDGDGRDRPAVSATS